MLSALTIVTIKSGRQIIEQTRFHHRTDLTAMGAGVDYSKAMNILAYTEKALGTSYLLAPLIGGLGIKGVRAAQDAILKFGPWLVELSVMNLGRENGLAVIPWWNTEDPFAWDAITGGKPSFNVDTMGPASYLKAMWDKLGGEKLQGLSKLASDKLKEKASEELTSKAFERLGKTKELKPFYDSLMQEHSQEAYFQRRKILGVKVKVKIDKKDVKGVLERGPKGRMVKRYKHIKREQYVGKETKIDPNFPIDLADGGYHSVVIISRTLPELFGGPKGAKAQWGASRIEVAGGNLDMIADESAEYGPFFAPVFEQSPADKVLAISIPQSHFAALNRLIDAANEMLNEFKAQALSFIPEILH